MRVALGLRPLGKPDAAEHERKTRRVIEGEGFAEEQDRKKSTPKTGTRLTNSPARPGPMSSTLRMKKICASSDGKNAT